MTETLLTVVLFLAMPIAIAGVASWFLHSVIALNSPPRVRAKWLAGVSYVLASGFWLFGGPDGHRWEGPFAAIPAGLLIFWFWHREFRRAWVEDEDVLPDGTKLANSDWKVGLVALIGLLVAALVKALFLRSTVGH